MTKKKVSIISHKRKITSRVRNKVTRKTFKKNKKGKTFKNKQYGGYNVAIVQKEIEEWNKELKKKCPTLELKFDYQKSMRDNASKKRAKIVSLIYEAEYILCLFNEVDCISSISFDFDYNKKNGKYYADINSETQEDMKNKKYNKFLRATFIKLLCVIEHEADRKTDIKAEYIYSKATNPISLLNLLPYKIEIRNWKKAILPFFKKIAKGNNDNLSSTYNNKKSENLKALLKEFIKNHQDYFIKEIDRKVNKTGIEDKYPIGKKSEEIKSTMKKFKIEINEIQKKIEKHTAGEKSKGSNFSGLKAIKDKLKEKKMKCQKLKKNYLKN